MKRMVVQVTAWRILFALALAAQLVAAPAHGGWQGYPVPYPRGFGEGQVFDCDPKFVDRHGTLWVGFSYSGGSGPGPAYRNALYLFDGETWKNPPDNWPERVRTAGFRQQDIVEDAAGNLWIDQYRWDGTSWKTYSTADGLADTLTTGLLADRSGGVWFGGNPVSHFDGARWETFDVPGSPPGYDGAATPQLEEEGGGILFSANQGIVRLRGGVWTLVYATPQAGSYPAGYTQAVKDREGTTWILFDSPDPRYPSFFGRIVGDTVEPATPPSVFGLGKKLRVDASGTIWSGFLRYEGGEWRPLTTEDGLPDFTGTSYYSNPLADPAGALWFGFIGHVARFDGERIRTFPIGNGFFYSNWEQSTDRHGNPVFLGFQGPLANSLGPDGVYRFRGNAFDHYTSANGLASDTVTTWLQSADGSYWFGANSSVSRLQAGAWRIYAAADNIPAGPAHLIEDPRGGIWDITVAGVARFDGAIWRAFSSADGLVGSGFANPLQTPNGDLWLVGYDSGAPVANRFNGSTWTAWPLSWPSGTQVREFVQDRSGNPWAHWVGGLSRFDGMNWIAVTDADGIPADSISVLFPDRDAGMWAFFSQGGAARFDGLRWTRYETEVPVQGASYVRYDSLGNLWISDGAKVQRFNGSGFATYDPGQGCSYSNQAGPFGDFPLPDYWVKVQCGIARFDGTSFHTYTTADGLDVVTSEGIIEDSFRSVWISAATGVYHLAGDVWRQYGPTQGVPLVSLPLLAAPSGGLWFWTFAGALHWIPDRVAPFVRIASSPERVARSGDLAISFTAPFEGSPIEYSFRFDGSAWSPWTPTATWAQSGVPDGFHDFEVRGRDYAGNISPFPARYQFEVDATPPTPIITAPAFGSPVRGVATVTGVATDARFTIYRVDYRAAGLTDWSSALNIATSATPITNGVLASWDTNSLPDGTYDLRLAVTDSLGLTGTVVVSVIVDNQAPFFAETAPVRVPAATGGDVYTTNAETHLYFPPHAFAQDALVMVTAAPAGATPPSLPSGAAKVLDGYELAWAGTLEKDARFTLSFVGSTPPPGTLALYRSPDGTSWERLGGTIDENAHSISLAVMAPGRYALYADNGQGAGTASLSPIAFTPRVFSPSGTFADKEVGISFTLGKAAPVTVKVYSRSGRLIREVVVGQSMNAGQNLVHWDGRDRNGGYAVDGIYLVSVEALGHTETKTLAVVK